MPSAERLLYYTWPCLISGEVCDGFQGIVQCKIRRLHLFEDLGCLGRVIGNVISSFCHVFSVPLGGMCVEVACDERIGLVFVFREELGCFLAPCQSVEVNYLDCEVIQPDGNWKTVVI